MVRPVRVGVTCLSAILVAAAGSGAVAADPTPSSSPLASPGASVPPVVSLGADTLVFRDDLSHPYEWTPDADDHASATIAPGVFSVRVDKDSWGRWYWHVVPDYPEVLRAGALVRLRGGSMMAGPMCGTTGDDPRFWAGAITNGGEWQVVRVPQNTTVAQGPLTLSDARTNARVASVAVECGDTGDGIRILLWVNGILQADVSEADAHGPLDKAGLYTWVFDAPAEARFQVVTATQGLRYAPSLGDATDGPPGPTWPAAPEGAPPPLGATNEIGTLTFDEPSPRQPVGGDDGWFESADGVFRIGVSQSNLPVWATDSLGVSALVTTIEADLTVPQDGGGAGVMCGAGTDRERYHSATVTSGDMRILSAPDGTGVHERYRGSLPRGLHVPDDRSVHLRMECAVVEADTDRVAVWLDDTLVLDTAIPGSIGPFDRVGMLAWSGPSSTTAEFDNLEASTNLPPEASGVPDPSGMPDPSGSP